MPAVSRRELLASAGASAAARWTLPALDPPPGRFRFVHLTDLHIQPELRAAEGVATAVRAVVALRPRPDFAILGGDATMDLCAVPRSRADLQCRLLTEALKPLEMPVYHAIGNHDVYGWGTTGGRTAGDPEYGKRMFEECIAKHATSRSFRHRGWLFVILDSIGRGPTGEWRAEVDDTQLQWMKTQLERAGQPCPAVIVTHVPLFTLFMQVTGASTAPAPDSIVVRNGKEVRDTFAPYRVKAVFQGHTHVVEELVYTGTRYITPGAVCGHWWTGPRFGVHKEGFAVVDVDGEALSWRQVAYGWHAVRP